MRGSPKSAEVHLRAHLARALEWGDAHVTFEDAVRAVPPRLRGTRPRGLPHSIWELVEHIRLAQADILAFCQRAAYHEHKWPDDYWPPSPAPTGSAWTRSIAAFKRDRRALQRLAASTRIALAASVPHGPQTYLRELLLVADHTAYHVGQIVLVRQLLGIWK